MPSQRHTARIRRGSSFRRPLDGGNRQEGRHPRAWKQASDQPEWQEWRSSNRAGKERKRGRKGRTPYAPSHACWCSFLQGSSKACTTYTPSRTRPFASSAPLFPKKKTQNECCTGTGSGERKGWRPGRDLNPGHRLPAEACTGTSTGLYTGPNYTTRAAFPILFRGAILKSISHASQSLIAT